MAMELFLSRDLMRPCTWRGDYEMDDHSYKNYKIALTHSKVTTAISPYLSHLNSTFFASSVFSRSVDKHYNVQETIHVLKSNDP